MTIEHKNWMGIALPSVSTFFFFFAAAAERTAYGIRWLSLLKVLVKAAFTLGSTCVKVITVHVTQHYKNLLSFGRPLYFFK